MLAGLIMGLLAAASGQQAITIRSPEIFHEQLAEMGYAPEPYEGGDTTLTTILHLSDETLAIVLGGCTKRRDCTYAVAVGSFSDVEVPPTEWVAERNAEYDLIKVWVSDNGRLTYSDGAVIEGLSRASFRAWVDGIVNSSDDLARDAIKAGFGPSKPSKT